MISPAEIDALIARLRKLATKATEGPWFVGYDEAHDTIPHRDSGLSLVETGRQSDWPIARLCESGNAEFIAACDPQTILPLLDALAALKADAERIDWLGAHPRESSVRVGTDFKACVFYGVACDAKWTVREAIDAARAEKL